MLASLAFSANSSVLLLLEVPKHLSSAPSGTLLQVWTQQSRRLKLAVNGAAEGRPFVIHAAPTFSTIKRLKVINPHTLHV